MEAVSCDNSNGMEIIRFFVFKSSNKTQKEVTCDETMI